MPELLKAPVTPAQQARDALLGALVGLARATTSEPKTDDTDEVLNAGLRLAAQSDAPEEKLHRMLETVRTEKAPRCPGLCLLRHALRQHERLRPCPPVGRTGNDPHPQTANAFHRIRTGPKSARRGRRRPPFISCCSPLQRTGMRSFFCP